MQVVVSSNRQDKRYMSKSWQNGDGRGEKMDGGNEAVKGWMREQKERQQIRNINLCWERKSHRNDMQRECRQSEAKADLLMDAGESSTEKFTY